MSNGTFFPYSISFFFVVFLQFFFNFILSREEDVPLPVTCLGFLLSNIVFGRYLFHVSFECTTLLFKVWNRMGNEFAGRNFVSYYFLASNFSFCFVFVSIFLFNRKCNAFIRNWISKQIVSFVYVVAMTLVDCKCSIHYSMSVCESNSKLNHFHPSASRLFHCMHECMYPLYTYWAAYWTHALSKNPMCGNNLDNIFHIGRLSVMLVYLSGKRAEI